VGNYKPVYQTKDTKCKEFGPVIPTPLLDQLFIQLQFTLGNTALLWLEDKFINYDLFFRSTRTTCNRRLQS
jgi:hypothetical protein